MFRDSGWNTTIWLNSHLISFYQTDREPGPTIPLPTLLANAGFKSQNMGRAQIKGWEISINGNGKIGPVNVSLFTGYTFIDPINPDYNPRKDTLGLPYLNVLKYRNRHLYKNDIQLDYKFLSVGFSTRYQSFMENIDKNLTKVCFMIFNPDLIIMPLPMSYPDYQVSRKDRGVHGFMILELDFKFQKHLKFLISLVICLTRNIVLVRAT